MHAMTALDQLLSQDLILQSVPDAIIVSDIHDRIVVWNPAAEGIYGWSAGDVIGKRISEIIPVLRYLDGASHEAVTAALATDSAWTGHFIQVHRDGRERAIDGTVRLIRDAQGEVIAAVAINRDITARKQAEQALREPEARYRTLVEHFPNGSVFLFDRNLRYTLAGGTGLAASGLSREMFEGKTLTEIFPPEIAARDEPVLRAALAGITTRVEVPFGETTFAVHTLPVADEHGTLVGGMVMTQDITERKRAEAHGCDARFS